MSRKSSIKKIKRDNSQSKNIESALAMYLYEKQHSPITTRFTGYGLAECDVISQIDEKYDKKELIILSLRINRTGQFRLAKPCVNCQKTLDIL